MYVCAEVRLRYVGEVGSGVSAKLDAGSTQLWLWEEKKKKNKVRCEEGQFFNRL